MKVRALRTQIGDYGKHYPGDEFTVSASYGKSLIEKGLAAEIIEPKEKEEIEETKEKKQVKQPSKNKIK